MEHFVYWAPRILSLAFVAFISTFSLDVFEGSFEWMMIAGFLVHLLPSFALLALIIVAWRYPLIGVIAFIGFAVAYVWLVGFDRPWSWYAAISLSSCIVGLLYAADWRQRKNALM